MIEKLTGFIYRYKKIIEEQENKRSYTSAESAAITKSLEHPFSFYERDREKVAKKQRKTTKK
jgi:hypothetical protein